jgi:hypothetical protein
VTATGTLANSDLALQSKFVVSKRKGRQAHVDGGCITSLNSGFNFKTDRGTLGLRARRLVPGFYGGLPVDSGAAVAYSRDGVAGSDSLFSNYLEYMCSDIINPL